MPGVRLWPVFELPHLRPIVLLSGDSKTIGRSRDADILLDEPSLSRIHAVLRMSTDGVITVDDQRSTNGVFVNGKRVESATLAASDRVKFGTIEYQVDSEPAPAPIPDVHTMMRVSIGSLAPKDVDREGVEALLATSRELMAFGELQGLLDRVLDRLQAMLKPARCAILLVDAQGSLETRAVRPRGDYGSISEFASATVVRDALAAREILVAFDARADARLQDANSIVLAGVRSAVCVPLLGRAGPVGALYADQLARHSAFTPEQVQWVTAFAAHAAVAIETAGLYEDRERHYRATLEALARTIDARDRYTAGHSERVTDYTVALARHLQLRDDEVDTIRRAGLLHDIGKVGVPDRVLLKAGPLDADERLLMESHVTIGDAMLRPVPFLRECMPAIRGHHERWDGKGYPDQLAGDGISLHARLMAVADSFDAMTSARPYRAAL
ncbi:MAG TPA: HD domain-containing phosphohydrolase, partial [Vicinamibacterales bacterium]|nr:HD domain-containing phosphohydrolase [Vicinamibacterales bacterium]